MSTASSPDPAVFVGIDVSKDQLDVVLLPSGEYHTLANTPAGHQQLVALLRPLPVERIVLESTGGYERRALFALQDADLPVALINPRTARDLARGLGQHAKTDRIDAAMLAQFARLAQPRVTEKTPENRRELEALVTRRRQLVGARVAETNRVDLTTDKYIRKSLEQSLKFLTKQIDALEQRIAKLIENDEQWSAKLKILTSTPGVALQTGILLLCELPELGTLNRQQVAALAGVAPYPRQSGKSHGKATIFGGRAAVRTGLYMAAMTARKHNPLIKAFAARLHAAGKAYKTIQIACIRKLLVILNTMLKTNTSWNHSA